MHPYPLKTAEAGISFQKAAKIMAAQHVRRLHLMKKSTSPGLLSHGTFSGESWMRVFTGRAFVGKMMNVISI
jgi:hypothetical protein